MPRPTEKKKALEAYRAKRSADATPEPFGGEKTRPGLFVVQKHAARRLHYDFRLELDGTLRSWAVPRGPSPDPADKRLAVQVEDHPVEYADFEGIIPKDNYGAGAVIVWDRGRWTPVEDPRAGLAHGKIVFDLEGHKLRGRWQLVRTKGSGNEWLLIKKPDAHAGPRALPPESVLSGLTLEELRDGSRRADDARAEAERLGAPKRPVLASDVEPMLAETRERAFSRAGWWFELKYDGFRAIAAREGGRARIRYRRGLDATATWPEIATALAALPADGIVLDGEIVVLDADGRPRFERLQKRALLSRPADVARATVEHPATLMVFDLLAIDPYDLRPLPLAARKALLARIVPRIGPLRLADHIEEHGEALYAEVRARGLEGIVGKRADSPYRSGRSDAWQKVRIERSDDFVVVGFSAPRGSREGIGALHVGAYEGGRLVYAGRVGTGFSAAQLRALRASLSPHARKTPAFAGTPLPGPASTWVEPRVVVEVRYKEVTSDGYLRQPVFVRVREDKRAEECVRARPEPEPEPEPGVAHAHAHAPRRVALSNLDKVFWPDDGYTKGDLIEYYRAVAPWLLPYLRDRPVVLTRYPDGIAGKSFFQKDAPPFIPGWMRTERLWSEHAQREIDYFVCDDVDSLVYLANLATIPLHVWASRFASLQRPDWCILDLDPKGAPFSRVVEVALAVRALCDDLGLPCFTKTSGQAGLHVLIPLHGACTFEQARQLAELLARVVEREHADLATTVRPVAARGGRVYLDYLQNGHGKLLAAPLSARPVAGALVSTPLCWDEVEPSLDPARFTIKTAPARLRRMKADPLLPVLSLAPDLTSALERLAVRVAGPSTS